LGVVSLWVVNASPIILLTKIGHLDLLNQLGPPIVIPHTAFLEIQRRGSGDPSVQTLAQTPWLLTVDPGPVAPAVAAWNLGAGESAVLTHALANLGAGAILDDQAARNCASALGIPHQGTLGLVIYAKQQGFIPAARPLVERLRQEGIYLSDQIINQALAQVGE
jgi:predicted nucleic acid-binding protein